MYKYKKEKKECNNHFRKNKNKKNSKNPVDSLFYFLFLYKACDHILNKK